MRRPIAVVLAAAILAAFGFTAMAAAEMFEGFPTVRVLLNGQPIQSDTPPINFRGRTLLPVRAVAEALGLQVGWDGDTSTVTLTGGQMESVPAAPPAGIPTGSLKATVVKVVDGDTVDVDFAGLELRLRLIGVDTPEVYGGVEPFGPEASAYTKSILTAGSTVWLELGQERQDNYGRFLTYVWLPDGRLFNEMLLTGGYGQVLIIEPNSKYADRLRQLEARAKGEGMGMWELEGSTSSISTSSDTSSGTSSDASAATATGAPANTGPYTGPYDPFGPDRDCGDFMTHTEAQAFFIAAGGPAKDPHRLDSNKDGVSCESLP